MARRFSRSRRLAFVVGNSDYKHAPKLANPARDVILIASRLAKLRFIVMGGADSPNAPGVNLTRAETQQRWRAFVDTVLPDDEIFIYYAGHGLQLRGSNYIVPVEADLNVPEPVLGLLEARLFIDEVAKKAGPGGKIVVALDACREDPFGEDQLDRMMKAVAARSDVHLFAKGFSTFKLRTAADAAPAFVMFATAPGELALDGTGEHSPFAEALTKHMATRGLELDDLIDRVIEDVRDAAGLEKHVQIPWNESNLSGDFYFAPKSWRPIFELGAGGFIAGLLISWIMFDAKGLLPSKDFIPDFYYLLGALFAPVIGYGTLRWGSGRWRDAILAMLISTLCFMPALWILANSPDANLGGFTTWRLRLTTLMQNTALVSVVFLCLLAGIFYSLGTFLGCKFQKSNFLGFSTPAGGVLIGLFVGINYLIFATIKFWLDRPEFDLLLITLAGACWFSALGGALGYAFRHYVPEHEPMQFRTGHGTAA